MNTSTQEKLFAYIVDELFAKKEELEMWKQKTIIKPSEDQLEQYRVKLEEMADQMSVMKLDLTKRIEEQQDLINSLQKKNTELNDNLTVYKDANIEAKKEIADINLQCAELIKEANNWKEAYELSESSRKSTVVTNEGEESWKDTAISLKRSQSAVRRMLGIYVKYAKMKGFSFPGTADMVKIVGGVKVEDTPEISPEMVPEHEGQRIEYDGLSTPCPFGVSGSGCSNKPVKVGAPYCVNRCGHCLDIDRDQEIIWCDKKHKAQGK